MSSAPPSMFSMANVQPEVKFDIDQCRPAASIRPTAWGLSTIRNPDRRVMSKDALWPACISSRLVVEPATLGAIWDQTTVTGCLESGSVCAD